MNRISLTWRIIFSFLLPLLLILIALLIALLLSSSSLLRTAALIILPMTAIALSIWNVRKYAKSLQEIQRGIQHIAGTAELAGTASEAPAGIDSLAAAVRNAARSVGERSGEIARSREKYEAIVSAMREGVLLVDQEERLISINPAAADYLGIDSARAINHSLQELVRNSELQRLVTKNLREGGSAETDITVTNNGERFLQITSTAMSGTSGGRNGVLVVLNDVTRLRRLEQVRRDFVANVSHELKTPITSIKGYIETLLDGAFRNLDDAERFLQIVAKQSNRLNAIIEDLLQLSRIEQGAEKGEISLEMTALRGLLAAAIASCETQAKAKNIEVSLSCPVDLAARINPPLLEQAVVNLIGNAVKYCPTGSKVDLQAIRSSESVVIMVRDNGPGIAAEHLPRLFERFYRVDKSRSRAEGGTGLGLAITKHIVLAHGGVVAVESKIGEGSTFTISLPCG